MHSNIHYSVGSEKGINILFKNNFFIICHYAHEENA